MSAGIVTMGGSHSAVPTIPETERRPRLLRRGVPRVAGDSALLFSFDGIIHVVGYSRIIFKQISSALISSIGTSYSSIWRTLMKLQYQMQSHVLLLFSHPRGTSENNGAERGEILNYSFGPTKAN